MHKKKGNLFVVSAPSGAGKTTICERVVPEVCSLVRSVSVTTRSSRKGEKTGKDYIFVSEDEFRNKASKGFFLEWAKVFGYYYGTPKKFVKENINRGRDVLLGIDVQGAIQIKRSFPRSRLIFILPPTFSILKRRLKMRKTDTKEQMNRRLRIARQEIGKLKEYDYVITNDNLDKAVECLKSIILAERCRCG